MIHESETPAGSSRFLSRFGKGVLWTTADTLGTGIASFLIVTLLARMLDPRDFGLAAGASVITIFFMVLVETAAISAVVQYRNATSAQLSALFWSSLMLLSLVYLLLFLFAPLLAAGFAVPELTAILRIGCLQLPLMALLIVPTGLLRAQLRFDMLAAAQIAAVVVGGAVAIFAAASGAGYWALVVQGIITTGIRAAFVSWPAHWTPGLHCRPADARPFRDYSAAMSGFTAVNYWARNVDVLLIGRFFGTHALGQYSIAYRLIGIPMQLASGALRPVLHPTLVAMEGDLARMRRAHLRLVRTMAMVTFPAAVILSLVARPLVDVLWGARWEAAAAIVIALAPLAAVQPVNAVSAAVYMTRHAAPLMFRLSLINAAILIVAMLLGVRYGAAGVAWGYSIAYCLVVAPMSSGVAYVGLLGGRPRELLAAIAPALAITAAILLATSLLGI